MDDIETILGQPPSDNIFADLCRDDERLRQSLEKHMRNVFAPELRKEMRTFSPSEAASLVGVTVSNLRKLHHDGKIPDVEQDKRGYRNYSGADIDAIRIALGRSARDPFQYLPGRRAGEHLQVLTFSTFKGGSAKTTSSIHTAQRLALKGYKVLAIDMDPQGSLTTMMGLMTDLEMGEMPTIYDAIRYEDQLSMKEVVRKSYFHNLDIAPAGLILSEFETETPRHMNKPGIVPFYLRLRSAIDQVADDYDIVIIDCPPQLGYLTLSSLVAATGLMITIIPNMLDVASLSQYLSMATSVLQVVANHGMQLEYDFQRYLLCRYEPSDSPQAQMSGFLRYVFGPRLMTEVFLKSTAVSDAGLRQMTLYEISRAEVNKQTLDRALDSINQVVDELERTIHKAWGRS